jgi:dTDP-D-glucose 4,6-dehydratase
MFQYVFYQDENLIPTILLHLIRKKQTVIYGAPTEIRYWNIGAYIIGFHQCAECKVRLNCLEREWVN